MRRYLHSIVRVSRPVQAVAFSQVADDLRRVHARVRRATEREELPQSDAVRPDVSRSRGLVIPEKALQRHPLVRDWILRKKKGNGKRRKG